MGAGRLRALVGCGAAAGLALLVSACASTAPAATTAVVAAGPARPATAPGFVAGLGRMSYGTFSSSWGGTRALIVCQQWAGLRGQYVTRVRADTPFQLEQWFSGAAWLPSFVANTSIKDDPAYSSVSTAFGLVSTGAAASMGSARDLDRACAAAD
jgi:hypothetical protein